MANRSSVTVSFRGEKYVGEYETASRILRVFFEGKSKTGAIRSSNPEFSARLLLIELVSRL